MVNASSHPYNYCFLILFFVAGFGLGALNDAEEDDLDVYDRGFNSSNNKLAYEADDNDFERITLGSRSRQKLGVRTNQPSRPVRAWTISCGYSLMISSGRRVVRPEQELQGRQTSTTRLCLVRQACCRRPMVQAYV